MEGRREEEGGRVSGQLLQHIQDQTEMINKLATSLSVLQDSFSSLSEKFEQEKKKKPVTLIPESEREKRTPFKTMIEATAPKDLLSQLVIEREKDPWTLKYETADLKYVRSSVNLPGVEAPRIPDQVYKAHVNKRPIEKKAKASVLHESMQALNTMFNVAEVLTNSAEDKEKHDKALNTLNVLMRNVARRSMSRDEVKIGSDHSCLTDEDLEFYKEKKDEQMTHNLVKSAVKAGIGKGSRATGDSATESIGYK